MCARTLSFSSFLTISASNETKKRLTVIASKFFLFKTRFQLDRRNFCSGKKSNQRKTFFHWPSKTWLVKNFWKIMFFFQIENSNRSKVVVLVAVAQDRCGRVVVVGVELKFVWQWLMKQNNSFTSHYFKKNSRVCASIWSSLKLQIVRLIRCQIPPETRLHKTSSTQPLCLDLAMLGSKFCLTRWHLHSGQDLHRTN